MIGSPPEIFTMTQLNMPRNLQDYRGEFVVFYPDEPEPQVLFHSPIGGDAHEYARSLTSSKIGRAPVVMRVALSDRESMAQKVAVRA